jgi:hypothetical protein
LSGAESRTVDLGTVSRAAETHSSPKGTAHFQAIRTFWVRIVGEDRLSAAPIRVLPEGRGNLRGLAPFQGVESSI